MAPSQEMTQCRSGFKNATAAMHLWADCNHQVAGFKSLAVKTADKGYSS